MLASLLIAAALLVACQRSSEPAPEPRPVPIASPTLEAEWIDLGRLEQRLSAERGRVVVVNYWATWCEPCREEFPEFSELQRRYGPRGVQVLGISLDTPSLRDTEVRRFLVEQRPIFPVFIKTAGDPDEFINAIDPQWTGALPATFLYDRDGRCRRSLFGKQTRASLERLLQPLLSGK